MYEQMDAILRVPLVEGRTASGLITREGMARGFAINANRVQATDSL
jgi:hypothetical protein